MGPEEGGQILDGTETYPGRAVWASGGHGHVWDISTLNPQPILQ